MLRNPSPIIGLLAEQVLDILPELIRVIITTAMQDERQKYLGADPYMWSSKRRGLLMYL